ncbi:hypothetical protein L1887_18897 [Cichorium endivia]|nr:hypothetical protein L1887_18897 [Cichorium endivia]
MKAVPSFPSSFPHLFKGNDKLRCLIPCAIDQEYYIRHIDGSPVSSEAERERVMQCLEVAIERRTSEELSGIT